MKIPLIVGALAVIATTVIAAEQKVDLKPAPCRDKVVASCGTCHSLDYIQANSTFMSRQVWDAEVTKMIKAFGAPISEADAREITEYLTTNYGKP